MESNLILAKTQGCSVSRTTNVNSNKIKVRVISPAVCREVEVVPSLKLGSHRNVSSCYHHAEFLAQNYMNKKRSGEPARFLSFRNGSWVDIEKELFDVLKLGFIEGKSVEVQVGGHDTIFDFYRMLQIDVVSWNRRSIAWFDVNGQPFFPKVFVDSEEVEGEDSPGFEEGEDFGVKENFQLPNIEIEIKIPDKREDLKSHENECGSNKRKWVKQENEEVSSSILAAKKRVVINNDVVERPLWPKTRVLSQEEQTYKAVQRMFLSRLEIIDPTAKITRIHQWTSNGPTEKARSEVFQMQLELTKKARGDAKMVYAWYGGTAREVETVLSHGFRMPTTKFLGSAPHGIGVYLTHVKSPHISPMFSKPDDSEEKHLILCRVILGMCEKVEAGSYQSFPSSMEYDTGVDDLPNPKWYTVWVPNMNTHIIPDCVVSFKTAGTGHSVPPGGNSLPAKLFTKLRSSLPLQKSKQLEVLCSSLKEGKIAKDVFFKLVRVVVGDDMLRATMQEII